MGASRKLQGEIDRVLKKVQEGVDVFDSIWNKVYDTDNANQKEKFEADLKKEIKKLQRYRDQIKTWIQSSEIKDKKNIDLQSSVTSNDPKKWVKTKRLWMALLKMHVTDEEEAEDSKKEAIEEEVLVKDSRQVSASYEQALLDARKQIEREMERFKICEKETKTKAFSKEGLGQQPKTFWGRMEMRIEYGAQCTRLLFKEEFSHLGRFDANKCEDPKEKAKAETRDWLNNVVGELESQIDNFEAEMEGLTVKKGKTRPPRLTHLETSIARHKAHIIKLELILRLLDNDELSPEQVNDVKDFLEDYVERNQEDFDEFSEVDELYNSLPLDKVEALEDLVTIGPPGLVKGGASSSTVLGLKSSLTNSALQTQAAVPTNLPQGALVHEQADEVASQDGNADIGARTPAKTNVTASASSTPGGSHVASVPLNISTNSLSGASIPSAILSGSNSVPGVLDNAAVGMSSPTNISNPAKDEDITNFPGRRSSPGLGESGLAKGMARGGITGQATASISLSSGNSISSSGALGAIPSASDMSMRNILGADDRLASSGMMQPLVSSLSNRMILPQAAKSNDGVSSTDSGNVGDSSVIAGRVFSPSVVPGIPWRPGSPFQSQNEVMCSQPNGISYSSPISSMGQVRGRTEIAPDQREKFLQRLQQVQQQGHSTLLGFGGNHKQFLSQQQNPQVQQFNSQSSSVSPHVGLGLGVQPVSLNAVSPASMQQQPISIHQHSTQLSSTVAKDIDGSHTKAEEQPDQNPADESISDAVTSPGIVKAVNKDDIKVAYAVDAS
ncbi:CCR4-Not complex component, Not N-terminal domain, partial [Dillenia turbinata]